MPDAGVAGDAWNRREDRPLSANRDGVTARVEAVHGPQHAAGGGGLTNRAEVEVLHWMVAEPATDLLDLARVLRSEQVIRHLLLRGQRRRRRHRCCLLLLRLQ